MAFKTYLAFGLAMLANLGASTPTFHPDRSKLCVGQGYATFYDDHACTQNGGQAVSMGNPGCLANEFGRNSVYIQASCLSDHYMVWSPGTNCDCQNDCAEVPSFSGNANGCWDLGGHAGASSFRFIDSACSANNC